MDPKNGAKCLQPNDNHRFTSTRDVRLAHTVRREGVRVVTPNQLLLILTAYLMNIHMVNVSLLQFIRETLSNGQF